MAVITAGKTFANGEQLSADKLNQVITAATFNATDAVDGSTMTLVGGAMAVADEGIATGKIASGAVNFSKLTDVLDDDTMATASATKLATSESIKAFVRSMRPKFVTLTGGTTALTKTDPSDDSTAVYNIADFTSGDSDFATTKITGLIVEGFVAAQSNTNRIIGSLPGGSTTEIIRVLDNDGVGGGSNATTVFIPINSDTTSFTLTYDIGNTAFTPHCTSIIKGAIIQPGL